MADGWYVMWAGSSNEGRVRGTAPQALPRGATRRLVVFHGDKKGIP